MELSMLTQETYIIFTFHSGHRVVAKLFCKDQEHSLVSE